MQNYRKETTILNEKKKEIAKVATINTLNEKFTERLVSKDKEEIGQKEGNKRLNKDEDRDDREQLQRVIKEET